ncbi:unnamed protein product [Rhizophagus irregularis]|uniref:Uncharacterized protein n=1 Tax=Rhizophagus irregularis TaxID=588596 RepID=A0A2N1NNP8_9GLOM|nr:hypothetical protein RhiirC2_845929 [Rhizophagus irregularis]CAB4380975.1 unnamed protein product [Rhizophagus irregularis]
MPFPKNLIDSSENQNFPFWSSHYKLEFFAAPQKDDRSQNIPKKMNGQFSGTLDVWDFSRVNTGKSAIVFSFRFQWFQMACSKFLF